MAVKINQNQSEGENTKLSKEIHVDSLWCIPPLLHLLPLYAYFINLSNNCIVFSNIVKARTSQHHCEMTAVDSSSGYPEDENWMTVMSVWTNKTTSPAKKRGKSVCPAKLDQNNKQAYDALCTKWRIQKNSILAEAPALFPGPTATPACWYICLSSAS